MPKLDTTVSLNPLRSQVVLVTLALIGAVALTFSFMSLRGSFVEWVVPLAVGVALLSFVCKAWWRSQGDIDREGGLPTKLIGGTDGSFELSADPRVAPTDELRDLYARVITISAYRKPLPNPNGIVNATFQPVPDSGRHAAALVTETNRQAAQHIEEMREALGNRAQIAEPSGIQEHNPKLATFKAER